MGGEMEIKANLSQRLVEVDAELGNILFYAYRLSNGHFFAQTEDLDRKKNMGHALWNSLTNFPISGLFS